MPMNNDQRKKRLVIPDGLLHVVVDTDAYNEVDDQFALCYAFLSPDRLHVEAVYAAPFQNERAQSAGEGMARSYDEICRILALLGQDTEHVFRGSQRFMQGEEDVPKSPAVNDLVCRAMARPDGDMLYVVAIGAITNIAAALKVAPEIADKIVIIWLGGHAFHWPDTREFNLRQDVYAARAVFDSGAPLLLVPCMGVASHMIVSLYELQACIGGTNALCDALVRLLGSYTDNPFAWTKPLWDVAAIAALVNPAWTPAAWSRSPRIDSQCRWLAGGPERHIMRVVQQVDRNHIFLDMYEKLITAYK